MNRKKIRELIINAGIFAVIMALTFWSVFRGQDLAEILDAVRQMPGVYLAASVFLAVFFVAGEGCMITCLLYPSPSPRDA